MHQDLLYYSSRDDITIGQLKKGDVGLCDLQPIKKILSDYRIFGYHIEDSAYHYSFRHISGAPYLYYWKGCHDVLHLPLLGIVGPRKMSSYAKEVLEVLFSYLRHYRIATVSGFAPGVDTLCHRLSLEHNIPTVAVLGGGFKSFLTSSKAQRIEAIVAGGGLVLSEYKRSQQPTKWTYPHRNRLIAALSKHLFVPEAGVGSGSLITVDAALSYQIPVSGVPQSIFHVQSNGLLSYIEDGRVHLVHDLKGFVHDYFGSYHYSLGADSSSVNENLSAEQIIVLDLLQGSPEPVSEEFLAVKSELGFSVLLCTLTELELLGYIREELGRRSRCL